MHRSMLIHPSTQYHIKVIRAINSYEVVMIMTGKCPICSKAQTENKHWVLCPKYNHYPVCMSHCYESCEHIEGHRCGYVDVKTQHDQRYRQKKKERFEPPVKGSKHSKYRR
jgi:hypothetical protein